MRFLLRNTALTFGSECILQATIERRIKSTTMYQAVRITRDGTTWEDTQGNACEPQNWPSVLKLFEQYERRAGDE